MSQLSHSQRRAARKRHPVSISEDDTNSPIKVRTKQSRQNNAIAEHSTPQKLDEPTDSARVTRSQSGSSTEKENNPDKRQPNIRNEVPVPSKKRLAFGGQLDARSGGSFPSGVKSSSVVEMEEVNDADVSSQNCQNHVRSAGPSTSSPESNTQELSEQEMQLSLQQEKEDETQDFGGTEDGEAPDETPERMISSDPKSGDREDKNASNNDTSETEKDKCMRKEKRKLKKIQKEKRKLDGKVASTLSEEAKARKRINEMAVSLTGAIHQTKQPQRKILDFINGQSESTKTPSGVIKRIKFFNFMCHDSFEKEWHTNVNFITGENGSGKSSILNGIIVGLGARAVVTSRTKSIKALIKVGKDCAKLEITMGNATGVLCKEKYGNEFTIQRVIDRNGASSYKIQIHGKFRPLRRAELDSMLLTLGIQLDNPVSILNQETARSFLKSKDPKDKYQLFYSGTLLDKCESVIKETKVDLQLADTNLKNQVKIMHLHREELLKLEKLMELIRKVEKMTSNLNNLEQEHVWSLVCVAENSKSRLEDRLGKIDEEMTRLKSNHARSLEEKDRLIESTTEDVEKNEIKVELRNSNAELENLKRSIVNTRKGMTEADASVRSAKSFVRAETKSIQDLEITIEKIRSEGDEMAERAKLEFDTKMKGYEEEKSKLVQEISTLRNDSEQFRHGADASRNDVNGLNEQYQNLGRQLIRKKEDMDLLKRSANNKYTPYGRQMQELVSKIQANASRFKELPRGPLGACISVKNEKWAAIIEHVLANHLFNFVVGEHQSDKNLLNQLIQQTYGNMNTSLGRGIRRPDVYIKKFESQPLDISRGNATMTDNPTILDAIEIENNDFIVRNALIDFASVERILLFDTNMDAVKTLKNVNTPDFPRTCKLAFSLDFYKTTPAPNLRVDAIQKHLMKKQAGFLKSSSRAQMRNLDSEIANLQDQIDKVRPALEAKRREEQQFRTEFDTRTQAQRQVERKYQQVILKIDQANRTSYKAPDISTYMEELEEKKFELAKTVQKQQAAEHLLENGKSKMTELTSKKTDLDVKLHTLQERLIQIESESENLQSKLKTIQNIIIRLEKQLKEVETRKAQNETILKKLEQELQQKTNAAEKVSPLRLKTKRDPDTIKEELNSLKEKVDEIKKKTVDKAKITEDLSKARKLFQDKMSDLQIFYILYKTIKDLAESHVQYFEKSRREIGNRLLGCYLGLLGSRRYQGRLIIDHEKKELYYFVCADQEANEKAIQILKRNDNKEIKKYMIDYAGGLSGGERSFATICFIIAMWQVMESPFFMLDEFDVFMDAFNRKTSQAALISHAQKHLSHQFFFFTPLDLSTLPDPKLSSILRLFPPVRDQSQLALLDVNSDEDDVPAVRVPTTSKRPRHK